MKTAIAIFGLASALAMAGGIGDVCFKSGFEGADALKGWSGADKTHVTFAAGHAGAQSLQVACAPGEAKGGRAARVAVDLSQYRGARIRCAAWIKAEGVSAPPNHWNGIKFMLCLESGKAKDYPQGKVGAGTFDWQPVEFTVKVPEELTRAELSLGLENVTGKVWFDEVEISVVSVPRPHAQGPPKGPLYKGHELARLRGTMTGTRLTEADLRTLGGEWKANHIRWQLTWGGFPKSPADKGDLAAYDEWLDGEIKRLDALLPICRELGMLVLVDLHTPPGGRTTNSECRIFHEQQFQDKFLEVWSKLAKHYRGNRTVWGYDLVNEPVEGKVGAGLLHWQKLAERAAKLVRETDPEHAIVVEPAPWGGPESIENLEPLKVSGVVYSVHMYRPHEFTHQGVHGAPVGPTYPGTIKGKAWDKEEIRKTLQPVRDFQCAYNTHIYIGEFSAIRWAPGDSAFNYLRDVIAVMEEFEWDWAYHAYREWNGWSVEHGSDPKDNNPSSTQTAREKLLREWFAKNQRAQNK